MVHHVGRLGIVAGLALLVACGSASAKDGGTDGGAAPQAQGSQAQDTATAKPEADTGATANKGGGGGQCVGKATFCAVYSQTFCGSQPGCVYSFASKTCGGMAIACEKATNQEFCQQIKGCSWK